MAVGTGVIAAEGWDVVVGMNGSSEHAASRRMFSIMIPARDDFRKGSIGVQAQDGSPSGGTGEASGGLHPGMIWSFGQNQGRSITTHPTSIPGWPLQANRPQGLPLNGGYSSRSK